MKYLKLLLFVLLTHWNIFIVWGQPQARLFNLSTYDTLDADTRKDKAGAFKKLFAAIAEAGGGVATIPAGDYFLDGKSPVLIPSNTTVYAYGARFFLPEEMGDMQRAILFKGENISNFSWFGGFFKGYCFDPSKESNTWKPNANTRIFVISTTKSGSTCHLLFRDIQSELIAGAVVNVEGLINNETSVPKVEKYASDISVENCTLMKSGKFMWDYGFLWQHIVFADEYKASDLIMAMKYFPEKLTRTNIRIEKNDNRVYLDNIDNPITVSMSDKPDQVLCFYGDYLPSEIIKGKQYYVVAADEKYIKISESLNGTPIIFSTSANDVKMILNMFEAYYLLYQPAGSGPGKGCIDLMACSGTNISGCTFSSLGDAMHIFCCSDNRFINNQILGARMGAFFLAEYSKNSIITGNVIDGNNGSRVMSIERSNENVLVSNNIFRNGGRGSWINQPNNLIIQNNIFINNTTKCERNVARGRKTFRTGTWEEYPEMYFTTYSTDGKYGNVLLKDNLFTTGPESVSTLHFEKNGFDIRIEGNIFKGANVKIVKDPADSTITIEKNIGSEAIEEMELAARKYRNQ